MNTTFNGFDPGPRELTSASRSVVWLVASIAAMGVFVWLTLRLPSYDIPGGGTVAGEFAALLEAELLPALDHPSTTDRSSPPLPETETTQGVWGHR